MKVLVISDTHGSYARAFKAHTCAEPVDMIIHLGDGCRDADLLRDALDVPVINVAGNCDSDSSVPREIMWECEGKRILLTHGDLYHVKSGLAKLRQKAEEVGADVVLFGHTHQSVLDNNTGLLMLNPGTLSNAAHQRNYAVLNITLQSITARHFTID